VNDLYILGSEYIIMVLCFSTSVCISHYKNQIHSKSLWYINILILLLLFLKNTSEIDRINFGIFAKIHPSESPFVTAILKSEGY